MLSRAYRGKKRKVSRAMVMNCWKCGSGIETKERVGFREHCPACDRPLHVCLNCDFHDPAYNNQCRETEAARVVDKDRANFCEFFAPRKAGSGKIPAAGNARVQLDSLFRKKT
jgi:hypothetical protein